MISAIIRDKIGKAATFIVILRAVRPSPYWNTNTAPQIIQSHSHLQLTLRITQLRMGKKCEVSNAIKCKLT